MRMSEEKLPVSETLHVLKSETLYKTAKWWSAVAFLESFGRKQVAVYLWINKDGHWKRQEKLIVHNKKEWQQIKDSVGKFIQQLP
jgi:hypothetical protein